MLSDDVLLISSRTREVRRGGYIWTGLAWLVTWLAPRTHTDITCN